MKKKDIVNLIRCYSEHDDKGFHDQAYSIADEFSINGDAELSQYIVSLLTDAGVFVPQATNEKMEFLDKVNIDNDPLPLPDAIREDVMNIINAISNPRLGVNKFLFYGQPGTGKTESIKHVARITNKTLYSVNFDYIIDSRLGETSKNISHLFEEINMLSNVPKNIVMFDEIDALAMNRTDRNDIREMGRAVTSVLKGLDKLSENITVIAATNLYQSLDKALLRRFDKSINFDRYSKEDLITIADVLLDYYAKDSSDTKKDKRLFNKILNGMDKLPYPGELKSMIRTSIAFSKSNEEYDYLRNLYKACYQDEPKDLLELSKKGFTVREIEMLTGVSRSTVSRELKEITNE